MHFLSTYIGWSKSRHTVFHLQSTVYSYLSIIALFSTWTTVNLLFPILHTIIPHFIALCFIALQSCCMFSKLHVRPSTKGLKLTLLWWSGFQSTASPKFVCINICKPHSNLMRYMLFLSVLQM